MTASGSSKGRRESSPLCLRVTPDERRFLADRAREGRHGSVSAFMRARLFGMVRASGSDVHHDGRLSAAERQRLLAQILGALGASKALGRLCDLADAARIGALPLTPDVVAEIRAACAAIIDIRDMLLRALEARPGKERGHDCQG